MDLKQYPSLQKVVSDIMKFVDSQVKEALDSQTDGGARLYMDDVCDKFWYKCGYALDQDLFQKMLSEREEFSGVEREYDKMYIEVAEAYQKTAPFEVTQKNLNLISANHVLWKYGAGGEQADLSDCVLRGLNMVGMNLSDCNCESAVFEDCDMRYAEMNNANFNSAKFINCDMRGMDAEKSKFNDAEFRGCVPSDSIMKNSTLSDTSVNDCQTDAPEPETRKIKL